MLFIIPGKLNSLNEYISACRTNAYVGNKMKQDAEQLVSLYIPKWEQYTEPVMIEFDYYEANVKRDIDNVGSFAKKVILDALVGKNVLINDSQRYVKAFIERFHVDSKNPRIEVRMREFKEV